MSVTEHIRTPHQSRSRETLTRILDAAETLMAEKPFEKVTIQEIVKRAKTTTGSFYARFADKNALLAALFDNHVNSISDGVDNDLAAIRSLPPRAQVARIVAAIADGFRLRPALMRSGTLHVWNRAKGVEALKAPARRHGELVGKLRAALEHVARDMGCADPERKTHFALKILLSASRQNYLFTDEQTILVMDDGEFQYELTEMVFSYLHQGE